MSKKDVLHVPPSPVPEPRREAGTEQEPLHPEPPIMTPDEGPDGTPGLHHPRIITPQGRPGRYPGVSVT